ncbi:MAG: hypothetical protein ACXACY_25750 [Candidatus Hodarchaeales archaeon]|jgi:hypothetical protein
MKINYFIFVFVLLLFLPNSVIAEQYTLSRGSVIYSDGTVIDSLQSGVSISGTMQIIGNTATQTVTVCIVTCATGTVTGTLLSFGENYYSVRVRNPDMSISEVVLLNGAFQPVETFANVGFASEVDQWVLTSSLQSLQQEREVDLSNSVSLNGLGGALIELLDIVND